MKRTTIFVPEALERDLQLCATKAGKTTAAVVREALAEYVAHRRAPGALPSFAGAFASGHSDTAERHEELLFQDVRPHRVGKMRGSRSASRSRPSTRSAVRRSR